MPSVRRVVLRARPDGSAAAARLDGLLPPQVGGWVPPQAEASVVGNEHADPPVEAPPVELVGAAAPRTADLLPDPPPDGAAPQPRSWDSRGAHLAGGRFRLDPGRRGAVALVLAAVLAAVVAGGVALRDRPQEVPVPFIEASGLPLPGASAAAPGDAAVLVVAVAGKVRRPGLFRLPAGSRVDDAVRAAGGAVPGTDAGILNLARRLVDGEQVLVGVAPPPGAPAAGGSTAGAGALLDLNVATVSDLDALPGIGPVLAQRIVDWRTENGRFASADQLREVTGIGEAKYQDLREKVTV